MKTIPKRRPLEPRRRDAVRNTVNGRRLVAYVDEQRLTISTQCPSKWLFVDLEDGNIWTKAFEEDGWREAPMPQLKDAAAAIAQAMRDIRRARRLERDMERTAR